jgi:hypothetical protein
MPPQSLGVINLPAYLTTFLGVRPLLSVIITDHIIPSVYTDGIYRILKRKNSVITWNFSDDFTDGMTERFKSVSPYSDMMHSPSELPTGIPTELIRR